MTTPGYYALDRSTTYPPRDIPILKWWENHYDHVFVALHPFMRVAGYSPRSAAIGPMHIESAAIEDISDILKWPDRENGAPDDFDDIVKRIGKPIRWADVNVAVGGYPFDDFCKATWMATVEFRREDSNEPLIQKILEFADQTDLYLPGEDCFPSILETAAGKLFDRLGISRLIVDDEFEMSTDEVDAPALMDISLSVVGNRQKINKIYDIERNILIINHFDDISCFIAIKHSVLEKVRPQELFEGFFVGANVYSDWMNPLDFFKRNCSNIS